ncbi:DUF642 domain-containing protein [Lacipirellula parvula]|uniref:DUF642 domain-containing protein n=1 Tax=Lacipirellula parvula TaxID=2650471 RepID=UPI0012606F83|nr:DUF642 domain-containing protein [Lacipirellula parvula]
MKTAIRSLLFTAVLATGNALGANLVTNGSFEQGPPIPGRLLTINAPDGSTLPGWTVASNDLEIVTNVEWPAADGSRSIDLNGVTNASMYQDVGGLNVGSSYLLSFALSGNPYVNGDPVGTADNVKNLRVSIAGVSTDLEFDVAPYHWPTPALVPNMGWRTENMIFVATNATERLLFASLDPFNSTRGPAIDNVSVTLVPEPAVLWLAAAWAVAPRWRRTVASRPK